MCDFASTLKGSLEHLSVPGSHFETRGLADSNCFTNSYLIQQLIGSMISFLKHTSHPMLTNF